MSEKSSANASASGGIGFAGALTIAFIVLKLCGVIDWPWLWVLSPMWIGAAVVAVMLLAGVAIIFALGGPDRRSRRRTREDRQRRREGRPLPHEHGPRHRWGRRDAP